MIVLYAIAAISGGLALAVGLLIAGPDPRKIRSQKNLRRGMDDQVKESTSWSWLDRFGMRKILESSARRSRYSTMIAKAGWPDAWTVDRILSAKLIGGFLLGGLLLAAAVNNGSAMMFALAIGAAIFGFFLPDILLYNQALKRTQAIDLELADTLDQMSIAVQAGLGFDAAMMQIARQGKGVLAGEFMRTLQDLQVGRQRRAAYEDLAARAGSTPLRRFIRTIVQADSYGLPLSDVLHSQAGEMRRTRRQEAERKAMQIPVKIIFPLMICILPALFIVIIGPAAISIMESFGTINR